MLNKWIVIQKNTKKKKKGFYVPLSIPEYIYFQSQTSICITELQRNIKYNEMDSNKQIIVIDDKMTNVHDTLNSQCINAICDKLYITEKLKGKGYTQQGKN